MRVARVSAPGLHRAETGVIVGHLRSRISDERKEQLDDVGTVLRELIRSAVAAEHDVLWHGDPPDRELAVGIHVPGRIGSTKCPDFFFEFRPRVGFFSREAT
jgi:hypothetical protein